MLCVYKYIMYKYLKLLVNKAENSSGVPANSDYMYGPHIIQFKKTGCSYNSLNINLDEEFRLLSESLQANL